VVTDIVDEGIGKVVVLPHYNRSDK